MQQNVPHYIRKNEAARIPDRFIVLDAEAHREKDGKGEIQTWALACASYLLWNKSGTMTQTDCRYDTPISLWESVSLFTRPKRRTVLYAHNLNYDLRITEALSQLPILGWALQDMRLDGRGSWSRWTRNHATLLLCDSASIFPVKLEQLATTLGMTKLPLPVSSQREKLFARCERDVAILSAAISTYVEWLRTGIAGNWQMTGAGQSWAHFRHSHMSHPILIHNDEAARTAERVAMHTGRAEAWQWGKRDRERLWEYDWSNSYPRIARDVDLPASLFGTVPNPSFARTMDLAKRYCVLADVTVSTPSACVPASHSERILWPTGQFRTVLWDPELALLEREAATVTVHKVWLYKKAPVLKEWAQWILSQLGKIDDSCPSWLKLILKHWSRALIGRFGMQYKQWENFATASTSRIYCSELYDPDTGDKSQLLQVGTDVFTLGSLTETNDACPQITGYIMSEARAKLWRTVSQVGHDNVYYMDTDSMVVNHSGHYAISQHKGKGDFDGLRTKGSYRSCHIYGPRSAIFDSHPTVAGMPKNAINTGDHKWSGEVWQSIGESIKHGESGSVRTSYRGFTMRYNINRRAFLDSGGTAPYSLPSYSADLANATKSGLEDRVLLNDYPALRALIPSAANRHRPQRKQAIPV